MLEKIFSRVVGLHTLVVPEHFEPGATQIAWSQLPDGTVIHCKRGQLQATDGDTVWMTDGPADGRAEFRVLGLNAPEVTHRKRANDLHVERGKRAAARLTYLLSIRTSTLVLGHGDQNQPMHHSRRFAKLFLDGRDIVDIACKDEGWGARWIPGGYGPDWNRQDTPFKVPSN
jgi:hypothetical protein